MPFGVAAAAGATALGASAGTAALVGAGGALAGKLATSALTGGAQSGAVSGAANQARADLQPWVTSGSNALNQTNDLLGLNGPDAATKAMQTYQTSPGYQFQLGEGLRSINQNAAAQGAFRSGATVKAEQTFGQNLADSDFGQYYNRLFDLAHMGQSSASGQADVSQALGKQQSSIYGNIGSGIDTTLSGLAGNPAVQKGINSLFTSTPTLGSAVVADPQMGNSMFGPAQYGTGTGY